MNTQANASEVVKEGLEQASGTAQAAPANPAVPAESTAVVSAFSADDDELARLEAEQAAIEKASTGATGEAAAAPAANAEPGAEAAGTGQPPAKGNETQPAGSGKIRDPKDAAIIALRRAQDQLKAEKARLEGENRVLREVAGSKVQGQESVEAPPAETVEDKVAKIDQQLIDLAEQYDSGKISTAEWKKQELKLLDERAELKTPAPVAVQAPVDDSLMEQHVEKLIDEYPLLNILTKEQLDPFFEQAIAQAEAEGKPIPSTNRGTMELRERMAKLATAHYKPLLTKIAGGNGSEQPADTSKGSGSPAPALSPAAAAREQKLELAGKHPPDIGNIGAGAPGGGKSEAQIMADLAAFGGDDEAMDKYLRANASLVSNVMRGVLPA